MSWELENNENVMKPEDVKFDFLEEEEGVVITKDVENKIKYVLEKYKEDSLEWMAALIGHKREDGRWIVEDIRIMEQEVTSVHVEPTPAGQDELAGFEKCIGWIHSHNKMDTFFSGTDWGTVEMYDVSICVNNDFDFYAACLREVDCPNTNAHGKKVIKKLTVYMESDVLSEEQQKELDEACEKNIKEKVYSSQIVTTSYNRFGKQATLNWGGKNVIEDQPFLTELMKKKIKKFADDEVKVEDYMEKKKKKLLNRFGHTWVCPLSGEILGRDLENIVYSPYHDQYVLVHCFEEFMGDLSNDPDGEEGEPILNYWKGKRY